MNEYIYKHISEYIYIYVYIYIYIYIIYMYNIYKLCMSCTNVKIFV